MATCPELLQRSEEMKITCCEIRDELRMFQCVCCGRARLFCTLVFMKENLVSTPVFVTLHSLRKLPLVGDEFHLGMFSLNAKPLLHLTFQSPTMYPSTTTSSKMISER
ncbi:hypothetical protein AVEN_76161-1 [Araneus ventricosus]|uniref:Uncharacterized protein n=1 Tax=Araneus ventricosus TaxID=182803 RepID=A0A4Y2E5K7_ARAVE|nr:hypothetical protein AVEN_76161-1 [Araneus ventricosus]